MPSLCRDPTIISHSTVDISSEPESQAPALNSEEEEEVVDKEEEKEYGRQATRKLNCTVRQDLALTPLQPSQSHQSSMGEPIAGEGTLGKSDTFSITGIALPN